MYPKGRSSRCAILLNWTQVIADQTRPTSTTCHPPIFVLVLWGPHTDPQVHEPRRKSWSALELAVVATFAQRHSGGRDHLLPRRSRRETGGLTAACASRGGSPGRSLRPGAACRSIEWRINPLEQIIGFQAADGLPLERGAYCSTSYKQKRVVGTEQSAIRIRRQNVINLLIPSYESDYHWRSLSVSAPHAARRLHPPPTGGCDLGARAAG